MIRLYVLGVLFCVSSFAGDRYENRAAQLMNKSIVIDGELSLLKNKSGTIPEAKGAIKSYSGVNVGFWTFDADSIARVGTWVKTHSDAFILVSKASDFDEIERSGKFGALLFIEESPVFGGDLTRLKTLRDAGLGVFQIAYGDNNELGAGFRDDQTPLTAFGAKVVQELNRLGVTIDVSHVGKQTVLDVTRLSKLPVIAGHTNSEIIAPHTRNKSNEELIAIAKTGGVIGLTPIQAYLKTPTGSSPGLREFADHVEALVKLVGIDHVGLGSDSYLDGTTAEGYELAGPQLSTPRRWRHLVAELMKRGYSDPALKKILGLNFKRAIQANLNARLLNQ